MPTPDYYYTGENMTPEEEKAKADFIFGKEISDLASRHNQYVTETITSEITYSGTIKTKFVGSEDTVDCVTLTSVSETMIVDILRQFNTNNIAGKLTAEISRDK